MATILAYTSPARGNLYPMLALLIELRRRGHRIVLKTLAAGVSTGCELGFEASAVDRRIEAAVMTDWMAPNGRTALKMAFAVFGQRAAYEVEDVRAASDTVRPDVLMVDANCWGAAAAAEAGSLPWVSFWAFTPFLRSRGAPPFGPGVRPWPGPLGRLRDAALRPLVTTPFEKALLGPLKAVRQDAGATAVGNVDELLRRAPLMLVATGEPFEYPHPDWGDSVALIGPCDFDPPAPAPEWLETIDRPIVLVTTSSDRQADDRLPIIAMAALAEEPVHVVATYPSGMPGDIAVPANATVREFVPHGLVLDRAVVAITHGGMGSTQKALSRGVPVCVVPFGRDQFEVARRVVASRSGTRLPARKLTAERLKDQVLQAMSMSDGAQRVAEGFRSTGGVARGADLIERRLIGVGS
ncbi:nucleotide disphospho-sugar-binding domain-containing protein [Mycobacterium angelicum]|uniref:Glycosyl transferase n=1 Tax=Mycobacterium angelicum TaxID=470074 RepID=A0A1W9ZY41_MYCAN|nr:nucleotide disphospho-sugar-binding domain-containing protein [Mycobacterium angelicum]MCV7198061.1 glycosyltransferase [Mycobacterium angelicum]ORA22689.1 glycosyl transferase [Mycobacterium angelicum]